MISFLLVAAVLCLQICCCRSHSSINFIRGGTDAPPDKYKFFAGLHVRFYGLICGGTLIHPSVVLTAGHCRNFGRGNFPLFMFHVEINGESYSIESAATHPSFDPKNPQHGNDLVLLYLSKPVHDPTIVELNSDLNIPSVSNVLSVAGFGLFEDNWYARPKTLQEVTDLISVNCTVAPQWWFHESKNMICTRSGLSGANLCTFDSGSPLLFMTSNNSSSQGMLQVGITSLGDAEGNPACSTLYVGFTAVSNYYEWIQSNIPSRTK